MSGNITKRGKNSWRLKFDIGCDPISGKRRIRYLTFRGTKSDAGVKLANLIAENSKGQYVDTSKIAIREFVARWERDWAATHVSAKTFERYSELLRNHVVAYIGDLHLQKLRAVDLNELYGRLLRIDEDRKTEIEGDKSKTRKRPLAARTVGHVHRVLHRMLGHANRWGVVRENVAALVTPPRVASTEIRLLTPAQVQAVLKYLEGRTVYPICVLALATGMRRGELLALRWCDVDLKGEALRVEQSLEQTKKHGLRFKAPKTKHGRRRITLPPTAITVLREHWKTQQTSRLKIGVGKAPPEALVFPTWDFKPRSPNSLTKEWREAVKNSGMPRRTFHSLRHTHASHLIAFGQDVLAISRRLGHGSPTITLNVYGHLFANADDRSASAIETMFTIKQK